MNNFSTILNGGVHFMKKRFKMYKSGKLWCFAAIAFASFAMGTTSMVQSANADTVDQNTTSTQVTSSSNENNGDVKQADNVATENTVSLNTSSSKSDVSDQQNLNALSTSAIQANNNSSSNSIQDSVNNKINTTSNALNNNVNANAGSLDSYNVSTNDDGQTTLHATGWQATGKSNSEPYRWAIAYDNTINQEVARVKVAPQTRTDVQRAYPNIVNSSQSGFDINFTLPSNLAGHSISIVARYSNDGITGEGQHTDYWFAPITFDRENRASLDNISSDDKGNVTVTGWHATNQAAGKKYHYIIAYDQTKGQEITRQLVTPVSRPDVATAFQTIGNANDSGFNVSFKLSPQYAEDNIQFISRWTNDPEGNGNAVDYWFGPVTKTNRGDLETWNISSGNLVVSGWHANDASLYEPYHYLILFDNTTGTQVASKKVATIASDDIAKVYGSDTRSANKSRFNTTFDGVTLTAGHTYSLVSRYSIYDGGNGDDGNGSDHTDYWYPVQNFNESKYSIDSWQPAANSMTLSGWFANDVAAAGYRYAYVILLDDQGELGRQRVDLTQRADVANAYPELFNSLNSGFETTINFDRTVNGSLQVVFRFTNDSDGNGQNTADIYTDKYSTNAGFFDNLSVDSNSINISGWHAADNISDKPYQYIIAMDSNTNTEIARWNVTANATERYDVQSAYPWILNSNKSGFSLSVNGVNLTNHAGVYFIHRYTDDAAGNGNFVDYDSNVVSFVHYNMYANSINAFIANNHVGHAGIQTYYVIPEVTGSYETSDGKPNMVVVHETANPNDSIWGEINYEKSTYNNAFVHAFVDGNNIIEISPTDRQCWGAGYPANGRAVQFEQVEVYGRDNFVRELVNAAYYTAYKMKQYGMIPNLNGASGNLFSHHMVSQYLGGTDHTDPDAYWSNRARAYFGSGYTMNDFFELVKYEYTQL
jgi:bifunctional autolysin